MKTRPMPRAAVQHGPGIPAHRTGTTGPDVGRCPDRLEQRSERNRVEGGRRGGGEAELGGAGWDNQILEQAHAVDADLGATAPRADFQRMECGRIERLGTQRGERATPRVPIARIGRTAESHRVDQHPRDPSARSDHDTGRAGYALGEPDIDLRNPIARQDEPLTPGDGGACPRSVTRPGLMSQSLAVATPSGRVGGEPPSLGSAARRAAEADEVGGQGGCRLGPVGQRADRHPLASPHSPGRARPAGRARPGVGRAGRSSRGPGRAGPPRNAPAPRPGPASSRRSAPRAPRGRRTGRAAIGDGLARPVGPGVVAAAVAAVIPARSASPRPGPRSSSTSANRRPPYSGIVRSDSKTCHGEWARSTIRGGPVGVNGSRIGCTTIPVPCGGSSSSTKSRQRKR